jgi:hypothetical protein
MGKGATFTVLLLLLPLRSIDVVHDGRATTRIVMDVDAHQLMRWSTCAAESVPLVDDNEDILNRSRRVLEERGAGVVTVTWWRRRRSYATHRRRCWSAISACPR